jgi:hypothetical protein
MHSVPITTDVVSLNLDQGEVYNIMWFVSDLRQVSSINKTDRHMLKVALNTIKQTKQK